MYLIMRCTQLRYARSKFLNHYRQYNVGIVNETNRWLSNLPSERNIGSNRTILNRYDINNSISNRSFTLSSLKYGNKPLKPSSKVEVTVQELKEKKADEKKPETLPQPEVKRTIRQKIVDELVHYYHGFRLLGIDVKISTGLVWRILRGKTLTRREYRLLMRTVGDLFRLVPFSVFIIVPFMEFLLPVFIKFFPGMLPSTFQTSKEKEDKIRSSLKLKLEMAKFLQGTLDEMQVQHKDRYSQSAKEFTEWFHKVRTSGEEVTSDEIMKFSKVFEDEITLDSLTRSQLIALCRVLEVQTLGTNNFLRFQLRMKLRSLVADDQMIQRDGVNSLTLAEVQQACRARGMRAYGVPETRLRNQLTQWLDLSLNKKVPPSLLLLSSALMLPETIPTSDKLKATISSLPETIVTQTKAAIAEKEGKIDHKVKIEVLKEEEKKIKEERREHREERLKLEKEREKMMEKEKKDKELLVDKAPVISATSTPILEDSAAKIVTEKLEKLEKLDKKDDTLQSQDLEILERAIDNVSKEHKFVKEKGEIKELKEELAEYEEDVEDLHKHTAETQVEDVKETVAAKRLFKSVNKLINKLDKVLVDLEKKEKQLKKDLEVEETTDKDKKKQELLKIDDIMEHIKKIKDVPDQSRIEKITKVLQKMDDDKDGSLKVEDVLRVIEIIGKENVKLTDKQIDELIELIEKEEVLEVEDKIEKLLQKEKETQHIKAEFKHTKKEKPVEETKPKNDQESSATSPAADENKSTPPSSSGNVKMESHPIIPPSPPSPPPPPPVNSIEKNEPKDNSKIL